MRGLTLTDVRCVFVVFVVVVLDGMAATPLFTGLYGSRIIFDPHRPYQNYSEPCLWSCLVGNIPSALDLPVPSMVRAIFVGRGQIGRV